MRHLRLAAAVLAAGALLANCSDQASGAGSADPHPGISSARTSTRASTPGSTGSPATTTGSPSPVTTPSPDRPVTLAFAGDIHFERQLRSRLDDPTRALAPIRPELSRADLTVANLETAITTGGSPEPKRYTFHAAPSAFDALAAAGVDVVTMANNHGVDYGSDGLATTLDAAADAPLGVIGIGPDARRAFAPYQTTIRGTRVAVLAADAFADPTTDHWAAGPERPGIAAALDPARLLDAVAAARRSADVVVVYLHWGIERVHCPTEDQEELARSLADAGADVVVGSHAHVQLGAGELEHTFVAYGLGNFVWYGRNSTREATTGVLTVHLDGRHVTGARWAPAMVTGSGLPRFAHGERARAMRHEFAGLRDCTDLEAVPGLGGSPS